MPLMQMQITSWASRLDELNEEMISIDTLIDKFQDKEFTWMNFWSQSSEFRALILSLPGGFDEKVNKYSAVCLGLLWCKGTQTEKATVFFNIITQGKAQAIHNDDLLLQQVFQTIVEIATVTIPKFEKVELNP